MTPHEVARELAKRIRARAHKLGMTMEQVADHARVGRSSMWAVLACERSPTVGWVAKVATALECRPSQLLP